MSHASYLHKCALKLAKWQNKAEDATTREEALKALRKYAKWSHRLADYEALLRAFKK